MGRPKRVGQDDGANHLSETDPRNLGLSHHQQLERYEHLDEIKKAVDYMNHAVDQASNHHSNLPAYLRELGASYGARFPSLGEIERTIADISRAIKSTPEGHTAFPTLLNYLGLCYFVRFAVLGVLEDIVKAIAYQTRAVHLTHQSHPSLPILLTGLGGSYIAQFRRLGELGDIDQAIAHMSRAIALSSEGHKTFPTLLSQLGLCHFHRFDRVGTLDNLVNAIEYQTWAVNLTREDHPSLPMLLTSLGGSYHARFLRLGELGDLDQAIAHVSHALGLVPEAHEGLPTLLSNLGVFYSHRFNRLGTIDYLIKSIEYQTRALNVTLEGHPSLPMLLTSLGASYIARFHRLGELGDIDQAITHISRALASTPEGHANLPALLSSLGSCYSGRFNLTGTLDDFVKGLEYQTRAVSLTPEGHAYLPIYLGNLGMSYCGRFARQGEIDNIEQAISHLSRAIELIPEGHANLPSLLTNLGVCYFHRFHRVGTHDDLENASTHLARALALIPEEHPTLTMLYMGLAGTSLSRYMQTSNSSHLLDSLQYFRKGSHLATGPPRERFQCALRWTESASQHGTLNPMEAYLTTIDLLPQFIWLGASTSQRYQDLTTAKNLAINAAAAAILCSNHALALEWLEHARCVVWSQSLVLHSPLDQLHYSHPALATRLQAVAQQLHEASSDASLAQTLTFDPDHAGQVGHQRLGLAKQYESLLARVRTFDGFEDFLRPIKVSGLLHAARNGPVVVINCHERCCDALIIIPGQDTVKHLPLPEYNHQKAHRARFGLEQSLRDKGLRQRGVKPLRRDGFASMLPGLWRHVVKPILDHLEFTNDIPVDRLPHITWCPTGAMSFLPLHAAGDYDQPRSCIFDYAVSSYTPTLTALLASRPNTLTRTSRVLAIGQANTPGQNPLPGTAGELECLKSHTRHKVEYTQLTDSQATVAAVLNAMEKHDWVHLACHAYQNVNNPTESGFFLHGGTLELTTVNRRSFKNKGLAFLSACQTATGDETLPDEAIHLASGMLMAGYPSVIATMWSVVDDDAPFIADKVYGELMKEGKVGNGEAGRALHDAVGLLREKVGMKEFGRWVPYIHIGS